MVYVCIYLRSDSIAQQLGAWALELDPALLSDSWEAHLYGPVFFFTKMGTIIVPTSEGCHEAK